jgi:hypothetical protein
MFYYDIWLCVSLYDSICLYYIWICMIIYDYIWLYMINIWLYVIVYDCILRDYMIVYAWPCSFSSGPSIIAQQIIDGSCRCPGTGVAHECQMDRARPKLGFARHKHMTTTSCISMQGASLHSMTLLMYRIWRYRSFLDLLAGTAGLLVVWTCWRVFDDKVCTLWPYWSYCPKLDDSHSLLPTHYVVLSVIHGFIICVPIQN